MSVARRFACPRCGYGIDAATGVSTPDQPTAGDLGLCLACAAPLEYRADGTPRWFVLEELERLSVPVQQKLWRATAAILTQRDPLVRYHRAPKG